MSLTASEHLLKRSHGQPRVHVTHLNIILSTGNWREPRYGHLGVQGAFSVTIQQYSALWTVAETK